MTDWRLWFFVLGLAAGTVVQGFVLQYQINQIEKQVAKHCPAPKKLRLIF